MVCQQNNELYSPEKRQAHVTHSLVPRPSPSSSREKMYQALSRISILQAMGSWTRDWERGYVTHVSANTRPHQLYWCGGKRGTPVSCQRGSGKCLNGQQCLFVLESVFLKLNGHKIMSLDWQAYVRLIQAQVYYTSFPGDYNRSCEPSQVPVDHASLPKSQQIMRAFPSPSRSYEPSQVPVDHASLPKSQQIIRASKDYTSPSRS